MHFQFLFCWSYAFALQTKPFNHLVILWFFSKVGLKAARKLENDLTQMTRLAHLHMHNRNTTPQLHTSDPRVHVCFGAKIRWSPCVRTPRVLAGLSPSGMCLQRWPTSPDCRRQKAVSSAALCVEPLNCVWDPGNRPIGPYCVMKLFSHAREHTHGPGEFITAIY